MYSTVHTFPHSQSATPQSVCQLTFSTALHMAGLKAMHLAFYGLIKWHSTHGGYEDRPLDWNIPLHTFVIFVLMCTITVCHILLYHTGCLTAQEQDGKVTTVMPTVTPYLLPHNFHSLYKSHYSYADGHSIQSATQFPFSI
jgi:hypothetical protein